MKLPLKILFAAVFLVGLSFSETIAETTVSQERQEGSDSRLAVLWTSGDPEVAHRVCLMYTHAAKKQKWFDEVVLIIWGPSARLLAADSSLRQKVSAMAADGVSLQACVVCADSYGVSEELRRIGVDVKPMGRPLTNMLKDGWKVLTF